MKPIALHGAFEATKRKETLKNEEERKEQEDKERGAGPLINEDGANKDATTKEILMNKQYLRVTRGRELHWR
jgi:hypothetical protein